MRRKHFGNYVTVEQSVDIEVDVDINDVLNEISDDELKEFCLDRGIIDEYEVNDKPISLTELGNEILELIKTRYSIFNQTDAIEAFKDILTMTNLPK